MKTQVGCLPSPTRVPAEDLLRAVVARSQVADVRGAFPVVLAPKWRHRLADLTGSRKFIPGTPMIAAAVAGELWLFSSSPSLSVGGLVAVIPSARVGRVDFVDPPDFRCANHRLQLSLDWFDHARITLARLR